MEEILGAVVVLGAMAVVALGWWMHLLRRRVNEQEVRLAELTRRVYGLESPPEQQSPPEPILLPMSEAEEAAPAEPRPNEDWETVIGGNWLNRVGALVLVIGIALFLGYSLTQLGPAGKVGIGFAVSSSMLAAGISLKNSDRYQNFALSLVGGGWAAVYFTAYAAHALEPARVIDDALLAGVLLFVVSAGMILHALIYASERGTVLAFVFSFITLNIYPLTGFSLYAALILAVALLALAYLRRWLRLAVTGVFLAYATFILRHDGGEPLAQYLLWVQWIAFEAFDVLALHRRGTAPGVERSLFALNAAGFIGASLLYNWERPGWFLFSSAAGYLVSTIVRARLAAGEGASARRVMEGGYEGALTASAALMASGIVERFSGTRMTLALLAEGEMILLAGYALSSGWVRGVGGAILFLSFVRAAFLDQLGVEKRLWTPVASIVAAVFAINRWRGGWAYSAGAGILIAMVINAEAPREWTPSLLALSGLGALFLGGKAGYKDIRLQHLFWAVGVFFAAWVALDSGPAATFSVALTVASFYGSEFLTRDHRYAPVLYSVLGTFLFTLLLFEEVQGRLLTVALGVQGSALLLAGMFASERVLRISGLVLFLGCIGKAFVYDLRQLDTFSRILSFIVLGLLLLGASWVYTRFRERLKRLL